MLNSLPRKRRLLPLRRHRKRRRRYCLRLLVSRQSRHLPLSRPHRRLNRRSRESQHPEPSDEECRRGLYCNHRRGQEFQRPCVLDRRRVPINAHDCARLSATGQSLLKIQQRSRRSLPHQYRDGSGQNYDHRRDQSAFPQTGGSAACGQEWLNFDLV